MTSTQRGTRAALISIWVTRRFSVIVTIGALALANTASADGISFYDVVTGTLAFSFNPTLSGGDFDGQLLSNLSITNIAGIRDTNLSNLALLGPSGISFYDVVGGGLAFSFNPTLSGGDFNGQALSSLSITDIAGIRDAVGHNLVLRGPSGISFYDAVTGTLAFSFNPTLSGGDFDGQSLSSLSATDVAGIRDTNLANLVLLGPSGISFYDVVGGGLAYSFNPTLSGGDFDGQTLSSLMNTDIAGIRDAVGHNLVLFYSPIPEPSTLVLSAFSLAALAVWRSRRRRSSPMSG